MKYPKISVIVPSYNQGNYIAETLQSVFNQEYPNLECIVVDGGSTDATVCILEAHSDKITSWVSEPDKGQTDALIKGFTKCTGEIMCWLNSDDLLEKGALFAVADFFRKNPDVDVVYGDTMWIDDQSRPLRTHREIPFSRFIWVYTYNYLPGMSTFWRRSIYHKSGGLNPEYDLAMDADLWLRFSFLGKIRHVRQQWSRMRFYPEQKNRRLRERSDMEDLRLRSRYWGENGPRCYHFKNLVAQSLRLSWRLVTGCYDLRYKRYLER